MGRGDVLGLIHEPDVPQQCVSLSDRCELVPRVQCSGGRDAHGYQRFSNAEFIRVLDHLVGRSDTQHRSNARRIGALHVRGVDENVHFRIVNNNVVVLAERQAARLGRLDLL